ncbi:MULTISPECIES: 30S ribosome-binding factor RbfA [unclassified Dietzia]|uniref:30S ribosome-binding factor RbfA n=1 Tax=unclassified Dietzia TaxID=2617939 RepID=UPI000D208786|nr:MULTISPECIES: 30S ribosome-binding factor RbfA [unclassified Dietzia]AVZ39579.1 ribosome-binding factor A [Dietzia sp. JS16-p6b]QGW24880.1 ribosome-binding factor A [Dietzia sp. DQ12-45-1b]
MAGKGRAGRLGKRIGEIVATAIEHEIKDPRLEYVTITDSRITADLRVATLYYTVRGETLDEDPDIEAAEDALATARGRLRTMVGKQTGVKFTPELTFVLDSVPDAARQMEELLARARAQDEEVRRVAQGARPAGDEDPYRRDDEEERPEGDDR